MAGPKFGFNIWENSIGLINERVSAVPGFNGLKVLGWFGGLIGWLLGPLDVPCCFKVLKRTLGSIGSAITEA